MRSIADRRAAGFTLIEYAITVAAVIAALVVMQNFLAGALGGKWREAGDVFGGGQLCGPPTCRE